MHAAWWMLGALAVLAIAYRYYSAFLAAKVLCPRRRAHHAGPHAATTGRTSTPRTAGSSSATTSPPSPAPARSSARCSPRSSASIPGFLWILFGVVLGGAVHDFVILVVEHAAQAGARSPRSRATSSGPTLGLVTAIAILFIVVIALAGLGNVVVGALAESAWGVFTVGRVDPDRARDGALHLQGARRLGARNPRGDDRRRACSSSPRSSSARPSADSVPRRAPEALADGAHARHGGLRLRRQRPPGVDAPLPARLPLELPEDRHHPAPRRSASSS